MFMPYCTRRLTGDSRDANADRACLMARREYLESALSSAGRLPIAPTVPISVMTSRACVMLPQWEPKAMPIRALMESAPPLPVRRR
jgi:hypothetical protein